MAKSNIDKQLLAEYRTLAKRADERLVRLERYSEETGFSQAKNWAYKAAMRDIHRWSGDDAKRFNVAPPDTAGELKKKIEDIKDFLSSQTSTKQGIKQVYKQTAETLNKNLEFKTNFSQKSLQKFWDSGVGETMFNNYGSEMAFKIMGVVQKNKDKIKKQAEDKEKSIVITDSDEVLQDKTNKALEDLGKELTDLV